MIPKDPFILLSFVNTKLRDEYASLAELCSDLDADQWEIMEILSTLGRRYDPRKNQLVEDP